jgi:hypothetical protein
MGVGNVHLATRGLDAASVRGRTLRRGGVVIGICPRAISYIYTPTRRSELLHPSEASETATLTFLHQTLSPYDIYLRSVT